MAARRVLYSVLFGGYETLLEQPAAVDSDMDRILFTDNAELRASTWEVRRVSPRFPADSARSSRRVKILAHEYVSDYDESLYVDNTVLLSTRPEDLFEELLPAGVDNTFATVQHSYRGPVRDEFTAVQEARLLDNRWRIDEQLQVYRTVDPAGLDAQTLIGGVMARRHHDPLLRDAMVLWWEHVCRFSLRDQLSLPFVLRQTGLVPRVLRWDAFESPFYRWPVWVPGTERIRPDIYDPATHRIEELTATLTEVELELGHSRIRADALDDGLAQARTHAAQLESSREQLSARVEELTAALAEARDGAGALERARQAAVRELEDLRSSSWWRATAPLRKVTARIKR